MRTRLIPLIMTLLIVGAVAVASLLFANNERERYQAVQRVRAARSEIHLVFRMRHRSGPIADETYRIENIDGVSTAAYAAVNRTGVKITVDSLPHKTHEVAFLFGQLVQDGIWNLTTKPPRGDTSTSYTIEVAQLVNRESGSRRVTFTDPHYWATTGGHQFKIKLDKHKPLPDLLRMNSTVLVDTRYEKVVHDFREFGSPAFRAKVADAQTRLRGMHT